MHFPLRGLMNKSIGGRQRSEKVILRSFIRSPNTIYRRIFNERIIETRVFVDLGVLILVGGLIGVAVMILISAWLLYRRYIKSIALTKSHGTL